jgi:hypothetical protein
MRILIFVLLLFLVPISVYGQLSVRTEQATNRYSHRVTATTGDTVFQKAVAVSGTSIKTGNTGVTGYVERLLIGVPVASDTTTILNGAGTVYRLIQPASAPFVTSVELGTRLDTSLIIVQRKTSDITLIYRITPQ